MTMSRLLLATAALLMLLIIGNSWWLLTPKTNPTTQVWLQAEDQPWRLAELGQSSPEYALLFFGYHRCPDICPLTLAHLARAYQQLPEAVQQSLQVVMVNVDPMLDDWQEFYAYPPLFHPSFKGVAGQQDDVDRLVQHFEAFYRVTPLPNSGLGYVIDHSPGLYLTNAQGERLLTLVSDDSRYIIAELQRYFGAQP